MTTLNLVSTEWLADHLEDPNIRIVDIRGKTLTPHLSSSVTLEHYADYVQGHIPDAVFVNWAADITVDPQHKRIAPPEKYVDALGKLGITNDHFIVAYDDESQTLAARLWWTLQYYGHTQAAVLDGGWFKWINEDRPTATAMPQIKTTQFEANPNPVLLRHGDEIMELLGSTTRLVDMRLPMEYNGEMSLARFNGHIPGAVNMPVNTFVSDDGTLLPPEQLRERFAAAGIDESAPEVIFYGNMGVISCLGILAMRVAGLSPTASNYDASWQEWGNDTHTPKVMKELH